MGCYYLLTSQGKKLLEGNTMNGGYAIQLEYGDAMKTLLEKS